VRRYFERRTLLLEAARTFEKAADEAGVLSVEGLGPVLCAAHAAEYARTNGQEHGRRHRRSRASAGHAHCAGWPRAEGPSADEIEEFQRQLSGERCSFHLAGHLGGSGEHPRRQEAVDFLEFQEWWRQHCDAEYKKREGPAVAEVAPVTTVDSIESALVGASIHDVMQAAE
jgi:hypothetical protein